MRYHRSFDVIIVGGGHAGTEAALAAARAGAQTLLLTQSIETLGTDELQPGPSAGSARGTSSRRSTRSAGAMAVAADHCGIHFRTPQRAQGSRGAGDPRPDRPRACIAGTFAGCSNARPGSRCSSRPSSDLVVDGDTVRGVVTGIGLHIEAACVVMTVGTFLGGRIHVGLENHEGGRAGDPPSNVLARRLRERGSRSGA